MVAAAGGLIRDASQISFSEPFDFLRANGTFLTPGLLLFMLGSLIHSGGFNKGCLVVITDVGLGSADLGVYSG